MAINYFNEGIDMPQISKTKITSWVKEVAASVGYPSQLAFSDAFFRFFGVRPSDYKRTKM